MKLYKLDTPYEPYMFETQSVDPSDNLPFSGGNYNDNEDFTDIINKIEFRLQRDVYEKKIKPDYLYEAIDFYKGPIIIKSEQRKSLRFFTVSPKLKKLLEQLKLPKHKFYPITLNIDDGIDLSYYILQIDDNMTPFMDYNNSSFYGRKIGTKEISIYQKGEIKSEKELLALLDQKIFPYYKSMCIDQELDWVYMAPFFMISEKSKQLFEGNHIVGMEITPFYQVESDYNEPNDLGFLNKFGGREIIINGKSTMDGLNINDFPRADKE